jgi:hypothetical protein
MYKPIRDAMRAMGARLTRASIWCSVVLVCSSLPLDATAQGPRFAVTGVEAKLFYSNSGRFSANILNNPKIVLHNVIIGEGTVEGPSENTLLLVRVQGPPKAELEGLRLRMIATTSEDTLTDREIDVGSMNTAGNYYAACWLYDTGCTPVTVVVQLIHGRETQRKVAVIPFECSE